MKKFFKIIFINLLVAFVLLLLMEFISLCCICYDYKDALIDCFKSGDKLSNLFKIRMFDPQTYDKDYREPIIKEGGGNPIIIFGCSLAEGAALDINDTFGGQISKYTGRSVYNRAEGGIGPQIMLYQLETERVKQLTDKCDYIIYAYIMDHNRRIAMFRCFPFLDKVSIRYKLLKNGELKLETISPLKANSNTYKLFESKLPLILGYDYLDKLLYKIVEKSYYKAKELYPNCKFILLEYSPSDMSNREDIEKLGVQVISLSELTDENLFQDKYYLTEYDHHPNAAAWELITPLFLKKAGIPFNNK